MLSNIVLLVVRSYVQHVYMRVEQTKPSLTQLIGNIILFMRT